MANVKISEMTPDASVGGGELLPASDSGSPKSVSVTQIKNFVIDQIEAISAGSSVTGSDGVFILQGGVLKPVDIDLVAQHAIDTVWGKSVESSPAGTDKMALKDDGDVEKTVLLSVLAEYVRSAIEAAILDVSDLADGSGTLAGSDHLLVTQGTTAKRVTLTNISDAIYAALKTYVTALTAVGTAAGTDVLYCIQGGVEKKVTLSQFATYIASVFNVPTTTTQNGIPQWSNTTGALKDGLSVATEVGTTGLDTAVPTEQAVREALDEVTEAYAEIFFPATLMKGSYTDGAGETDGEMLYLAEYTSNHITHAVHLFDGSAQDESVEWDHVMPPDWDRGTIKFKALWTPGHADANADEWIKFTLAAGALSNDDALDAALGAGQAVTDQVIADEDCHITAASAAITVGGTPALGDLIHFKLTRDYDYAGAGAAMDVSLRLFGIVVQYKKGEAVAAW